jgi:hypothetical protein
MKFELLLFAITVFFIMNTYYDGKYMQMIKSWKKYYQMAGIAFVGISAYAYMKKFPTQSKNLFTHTNELIKYMPIDKDAGDYLSPLLNMAQNNYGPQYSGQNNMTAPPQQKRMMTSGIGSTKRSVSETKKKYVASQQNWCCGNCKKQLPAWFEVDHKIRLGNGGSNHIDNLVALCRDCHGEKTAKENL